MESQSPAVSCNNVILNVQKLLKKNIWDACVLTCGYNNIINDGYEPVISHFTSTKC